MYKIDGMAKEKEGRIQITTPTTRSDNKFIPTTIITPTTDPWMLFLYALKAPATKEKYIQRLIQFLNFLGYQGTKEEKARAFADQARADPCYSKKLQILYE